MPAAGVEIVGLAEFRRELKQLEDSKGWNRELAKVHRKIGTDTGRAASGIAGGMGGPYSHFAGAIRGGGGVTGAKVAISSAANATFWGAKKRTGWYAAQRYQGGPAQHPRWVGTGWEVGGPGGPYAINQTIAARMNETLRDFEEGIVDIARRAFPN